MGLKVLLADDSAAIKKVVQICLQDFGVELKTVGTGKDVVALAKSFKPDIALIDVMLPQKTGYEVATDMKKDGDLQKIPIIMLWSSFMEFDEAKFKASKADGKMEKPFEAADLRALVTKLIPKTQGHPLEGHLELPKIKEKTEVSRTNVSPESWSMSSFEDISKFSESLKSEAAPVAPALPTAPITNGEPDSEWVRKDLGKFKVNIDAEGMEENTVSFQYDETNIKDTSFIMKAEVGGAHGAPPEIPQAAAPAPLPQEENLVAILPNAPASITTTPLMAPPAAPELDTPEMKALIEKRISEIVSKDAKDLIEKAIWKIVPDLATQMIKEEIQRLTAENN